MAKGKPSKWITAKIDRQGTYMPAMPESLHIFGTNPYLQ